MFHDTFLARGHFIFFSLVSMGFIEISQYKTFTELPVIRMHAIVGHFTKRGQYYLDKSAPNFGTIESLLFNDIVLH